MRELRHACKLELENDGTTYRGFLDVGVVPFGLMGQSCARHLRLGVENKLTKNEKRRYSQAKGEISIKFCCWATVASCLSSAYKADLIAQQCLQAVEELHWLQNLKRCR